MHVQADMKDKETVREEHESRQKDEQFCRHGGCFSWIWMKKQRKKDNEGMTYISLVSKFAKERKMLKSEKGLV